MMFKQSPKVIQPVSNTSPKGFQMVSNTYHKGSQKVANRCPEVFPNSLQKVSKTRILKVAKVILWVRYANGMLILGVCTLMAKLILGVGTINLGLGK